MLDDVHCQQVENHAGNGAEVEQDQRGSSVMLRCVK